MRAIQYTAFGTRPQLVDVERPRPGPGEVLLRITASGLCHSDEFVMAMPQDGYPYPMPMTLGHEPAGVVEELGEGASGVTVGDAVIVYGCWGCGVCAMCADGSENLCLTGMLSPGLGVNGAMAEFMVVDTPRHLVPIGDLDPVRAASLTDAALTPYQAIKSVLPRIVGGTTTVVIGAGGLGHVAIQLLRALTPTRVVALDIGEDKLAFARENGAHEAFTSEPAAADKVKQLTGGRGADVVLDFVGMDVTGELAVACGGVASAVVVVGAGLGGAKIGLTSAPYNMTVSTSLWGRRKELIELVEMARRGQVQIHTTTYPITEGEQAYEDVHAGRIVGRAVVVP
ncbi:NAD(P)-dependent alcohol dehydrogenase [Nocardioides sp. zg-536]|uniref:alcohol dehydrogenase n=1 Tax=Nocardioides faecalis TaxID=2803858 RepID=A0A939BSK3_9ACTN|nr:NAD(P)-dependent alcohol dehydrogenase [Nocardioides faecalis]MBM9459714.1 NAD(P)-dependent alcohol dehydrogenase [Nocardioides faecalis]QVI58233.1 NAD(P)-dependent alcohol dehydrogenase [Nocardioides faecalis]